MNYKTKMQWGLLDLGATRAKRQHLITKGKMDVVNIMDSEVKPVIRIV